MLIRKMKFVVLASVTLILLFSCASKADPITDPGVAAVIVTRRDMLTGSANIIIDGKSRYRMGPNGRWGYQLESGRHSLAIEYNKQRSKQSVFIIQNNKVEYEFWAFDNAEPLIQSLNTPQSQLRY